MKKRNLPIMILITMFALIFALSATTFAATNKNGSGNGGFELTEQEKEYIRSLNGRPVTLAATSEILSFSDGDGNPAGLLLPFIELLGEWGVKLEPQPSNWEGALASPQKNEADLIGLFTLNEELQQKYAVTKPLYISDVGVYTRIGDKLGNIVNIANKTVGVATNSALENMLSSYIEPSTVIKYFVTTDDLLTALDNGEIDVALTAINIQPELLRYCDVAFEMSVTNVRVPQCIYSTKPEMTPLIEIISRYLESDNGQQLLDDIEEARHDSILKAAQMYFADDIKDLHENYDEIRFYDSSVAYPLCYVENGEYKGFQVDINKVFEDLTGMPVNILPMKEFKEGFITAIEEIRAGRLEGASGIYYYSEFGNDPDFEFSYPIITDKLGFYSLNGNVDDLSKVRIGTTKFASPYIDWYGLTGNEPKIYGVRGDLIGALKKREIDVIFLSEMSVDYYYSVQNDYSLKQASSLSASADFSVLLNVKNKSFNKLYNEAIVIQELIYPGSRSAWLNTPRNDKFEFMRLQSELEKSQKMAVVAVGMLAVVMAIALVIVRMQLKKFRTYDRQISKMLSTQQNVDMMWCDIKSEKLVSKGNYPLFREWGYIETTEKSYLDVANDHRILEKGKEELKNINEQGLPFFLKDCEIIAPKDGKPRYIRRYTHKISEDEFMLFVMDVTQEKCREKELNRLANTDYLSELLNRRAMDPVLKGFLDKVRQENKRAFVIMLDIDDFKVVNDRFGHEIGDNVLIAIAEIIKEVAYDGVASRWGGEEFLVAIEGSGLDEAVRISESMVELTAKKVFPVGTRTSFSVTISCGVSEICATDADYMDSVARADKAMYIAKNEGKNCVRVLQE